MHKVLLARQTTHLFTTDSVDAAVIDRALLAAHHAPCHKLTWPWRFAVVGPDTRSQLADVAVRLKSTKGPLSPQQIAKIHNKVQAAGALIVVSQVLASDAFRRQEDYAAVCCAVQNLLLSVTADGKASKWGTGAVTTDIESYQLLGIDPSGQTIVGFIYVGTAAKPCHVNRPPVAEYIRHVD